MCENNIIIPGMEVMTVFLCFSFRCYYCCLHQIWMFSVRTLHLYSFTSQIAHELRCFGYSELGSVSVTDAFKLKNNNHNNTLFCHYSIFYLFASSSSIVVCSLLVAHFLCSSHNNQNVSSHKIKLNIHQVNSLYFVSEPSTM